MKITFVCVTETYLEAATLQEFLNREGIKYEERINDGTTVHRESTAPKKSEPVYTGRRERHALTGNDFAYIRNCIKQFPNWSNARIRSHFDIKHSENTIWRIASGKYDQRFISKHKKQEPVK